MTFMERLAGAIDGLNDRIGATIRWLTLVMVMVGAIGAVVRYFARGLGLTLNLTPATELQWYLFSLIFLLGAAYGLRHDVHVRVDVMYERLSRRGRAGIDLAGSLLFLVPFSILMLWVSWPAVRSSWSIREMSPDPGGLPRYPIKTVILLSFALLLLQAVSLVRRQVLALRGHGVPKGSEGGGDRAAGGEPGSVDPQAGRDRPDGETHTRAEGDA